MYGSETWTLNYQQVRQLRTVQLRHLRRILKIKWDHYASNEEALARACVEDREILLAAIKGGNGAWKNSPKQTAPQASRQASHANKSGLETVTFVGITETPL